MPSLVKILHRCHSTVREDRNSWAAISELVAVGSEPGDVRLLRGECVDRLGRRLAHWPGTISELNSSSSSYSVFQALLSTLLSGSISAWLSSEARPLNYDKVLGLLQPAGLPAIAGHRAGRGGGRTHEDACLVNIFDPRLVNLRPARAVGRDVENPVTDHGVDAAPISHVFSSCFPVSGAL